MFTGSFLTLINRIANCELAKFEADCPQEFKTAITQCFEPKADNRPDAHEFIEAVENVKFELQRSSTSRRYVDRYVAN